MEIPEHIIDVTKLYYKSIGKRFPQTVYVNNITSWISLIFYVTVFSFGIGFADEISIFFKSKDIEISPYVICLLGGGIAFIVGKFVKPSVFFLTKLIFGIDRLSNESIKFCQIYLAMENIEHYLINGSKQHLKKANKYLNSFFDSEDFIMELNDSKSTKTYILDVLNTLNKNTKWVKFSEDTSDIINALNNLENKLFKKILTGKEIEELITPLNFLKIYTYNKINGDTQLKTYPEIHLTNFAKTLNRLESINSENIDIVKLTKLITNKISYYFNKNFYSQNLIINLVCWFLLFSTILSCIKANGYFKTETYDSILLRYAFLGAIALAVGIFKKKQSS